MSDKFGDIARGLGCEVTEEVESLRVVLVTELERSAKLEQEIERLRAICKMAADTLRNHRVPQNMAEAGLQVFVTLGPLIEKLEAAAKGGGRDDE